MPDDLNSTYIGVGFLVALVALTLSAVLYFPALTNAPDFFLAARVMFVYQASLVFAINAAGYAILRARHNRTDFMPGLAMGEVFGFAVYMVLGLIAVFMIALFSAGLSQQ